jgi:antitoxin (DNA-binding transcriptional repressor) of toxin-antitoxin stability system
MKVFTYSEARQHLAKLLDLAREEEVEIRRRDGTIFSLTVKQPSTRSPFDVPGIDTAATTEDILDAVAESRTR